MEKAISRQVLVPLLDYHLGLHGITHSQDFSELKELSKMKWNKKYLYLIIASMIIVPALFLLLSERGTLDMDDLTNDRRCRKVTRAMNTSISGTIIKVFEDSKNHNHRTMQIMMPNSEIENSILLNGDGSGLFEILRKGDKIIKELNSLNVIVIRDSTRIEKTLDYYCK